MSTERYNVKAIRNKDQYEINVRVMANSSGQAISKARPIFFDRFGSDDYHIKTVDRETNYRRF